MKYAILGGVIGLVLALGLVFILSVTGVLEAVGIFYSFLIGLLSGTVFVNLGFLVGTLFDDY